MLERQFIAIKLEVDRFLKEKKMKKDFLPVIIGTDMNAYYVARCFHEEYGIKPAIIGKEPFGFTEYSDIIEATFEPNLWETEDFVKKLIDFAKSKQVDYEHLILIGTNDFYVRLIIENRAKLENYYKFNNLTEDQMNQIIVKDEFYQLCEQYDIDIPKTVIIDCAGEPEIPEVTEFPVIIKPGNGVVYYRHHFDGLEKVYRLNSQEEVEKTVKMIKASGYDQKLVMQEYIPGEDSTMFDSVFYMGKDGKAKLISFAQVLLQEHAPTAIGNYTALTTRYDEAFMMKLKNFMEAIHFVGFGNFDIKRDPRDGKYKIFEVNIRQGRSSYYVTATGHNLMKYLVDDLIYDKPQELTLVKEPMMLTVVPVGVVKKYVAGEEYRKEVIQLAKEGRVVNPLIYKGDKNFKRKLYMLVRGFNYYRKYKKYQW